MPTSDVNTVETAQAAPGPVQQASTRRTDAVAPIPGSTRRRITPNVFGIAFGFAGISEIWDAAAGLGGPGHAAGNTLWVITAVLWLLILIGYLRNAINGGRLTSELVDPIYAPFTSVAAIVPMMCGVALAAHLRAAGVVCFAIGFALTVAIGGWLIGQWVLSDLTLQQWHPGYFLPTVAGGFIAAGSAAELGYESLAKIMFGYGLVSWLVLGSIVLVRLFTQPMLPVPLRPTMAIGMAPPVVAGSSWFAIDHGHIDAMSLGLVGYAALMFMMQVRLVPVYRRVPFGLGWWAFSFSYAAVFVDALRWLGVEHAAFAHAWSWVLASTASGALAALVIRTGVALARDDLLPSPPPGPTDARATS